MGLVQRVGLGQRALALGLGLLATGFSVTSPPARADESASDWQFAKPSGRLSELFQAYRQRFTDLPDLQERFDAEVEFGVSNGTYGAKLVPWGWLRAPDAQGGLARQTRVFGDLKEAWIERTGPAVDIRAGNQIFAWGAADQVNPTDVWNPRDLYDPFNSPKLPIAALDIKIHPPDFDHLSLELIGTPFFRPSHLPVDIPDSGTQGFSLGDSRWFLPFPTTVVAGGGALTAPLQYQVTSASYPSTWQAGARLRVTGIHGWDFSLSYANLVESLPRFAFGAQGSTASASLPVIVTLNTVFNRQQMFGVDGAGSFSIGDSDIGTRFEAAYFARDNSRAYEAPAAFRADLLRDDYVHAVAGIDYTFQRKLLGTVLYLNLQYVHYQRIGSLEQTPGQFVIAGLPDVLPWDRNLVLYWEDRIGRDARLKFQGTWVTSLQNGDVLVSPALLYAWTDNFKTSIGADIFAGNPSGFFGQFHDDSRGFVTANYSF